MLRIMIPLLFVWALLGCESTQTSSYRNPSLAGDAGFTDDPITWEGDWTWEEPVSTCDAAPAPGSTCQTGERIDQPLYISVSADLLLGCADGQIIHLWDGEGNEHLSSPNQPLTISIDHTWQGWLAFNVTCGQNWYDRIEWSATTLHDLVQLHLISISSGDIDLTESVMACPSVTGSNVMLPLIPLTCGEAPC